jgi:outer membrane autotransporter protein
MKKCADPGPNQKALALAVAAALAALAPTAATADTIISTPVVGRTGWTSGNFTVTNTGSVTSTNDISISASGTLGTLTNSGTVSAPGGIGLMMNGGSIAAINNNSSGTISGGTTAVFLSFGTIGALTNSGTISATGIGVLNGDPLASLTNNAGGTISGGTAGVNNFGTITVLTNNAGGTISGNTGILNASGTIGALSNSGLITGNTFALFNDASSSLGPITNSGTIAGNIENDASQDLRINGGSGAVFGTLTGLGGTTGTITNTASNVVFGSGNVLLNDAINVGSNTVNNVGATLAVNAPMTITGNYSQGQAATLLIGVSAGASTTGSPTDTGYGRLVVQGNATIAAGSSVTLQGTGAGYGFAAGQRFVVVDATGTGTYNAGALKYSIVGYTATLTGSTVAASGHTDLVVSIDSAQQNSSSGSSGTGSTNPGSPSPLTQASLATAPNAVASLHGLLSYTGVAQPQLLNLYNATLAALSQDSGASANRIGQQLSPVKPGSTSQAASAATFDVLRIVAAHTNNLRLAQSGGGETGVATGEAAPQWSAWGQVFGGHASQGGQDGVDGYSANYGGLLLGVDKALSERWRAGGVFAYSNTLIDQSGDTAGDSTRVNAYGLIGYASYTHEPWYVNLSAGAVLQRYDTRRAVDFSGFSGVASGRFDGEQYVVRAEAGYPLALRGMTLTPLATLAYSFLHQGSYTESGGNGAALSVGAANTSSVRSGLGFRLERGLATSYGEIVPDIQAQWIHEYDRARVTTAASFAADTTGQTAFTTVGPTPVADLADVSLGVTLLRANNLTVSARYEVQAAPRFVSQTGILRLRKFF